MPCSESRVQMKEADNYCTRHFRVHHISTPTFTQKKNDLQKKKEKKGKKEEMTLTSAEKNVDQHFENESATK